MPAQDPVAVYNAANNVEAHLVCNMLASAGVEAFVTEDNSQVGVTMLGHLAEIHKPQVWVDRSNIEQARPILEDYARRSAELQDPGPETTLVGDATIEAICEECNEHSTFPAAQRGSVQNCPHCGAFIDVGAPELPDEAYDTEAGEAREE
jgi:Putative prokaryotic signal transducing protein